MMCYQPTISCNASHFPLVSHDDTDQRPVATELSATWIQYAWMPWSPGTRYAMKTTTVQRVVLWRQGRV